MAILTHDVQGDIALRFCTTEPTVNANITPMRLLVQHMTGTPSAVYTCVHLHACHLSFLDVAKWVLNKQIIREPSGRILYKYDLIDDFDSKICKFAGPLSYFQQTQDQPDGTHNTNTNQYTTIDDPDGSVHLRLSYLCKFFPKKYEAHNHMLHLMVSVPTMMIAHLYLMNIYK